MQLASYIVIEQKGWVKAKILLTNCQYIEKVHKVWFLICLFKLSSISLIWVITAIIFSSSVKKLRNSDISGVVLAEEQPYITQLTPDIINQKQINIRIMKLKCISATRSWSRVNNTVVLTILTLQHIQCLHLMYAEVAWALVSSSSAANNTRSRLSSRLSFRFF